jgi:hypothetical protein
VPRRDQYVPKHRGSLAEPALKKGIRKSVMFSGVAVAATGIAVSSGIAMTSASSGDASASLASAQLSQSRGQQGQQAGNGTAVKVSPADLADRSRQTSRSDHRSPVDPTKKDALSQESGGQVTQTEDLTHQDPRTIAAAMLSEFGFSSSEMSCLDSLWTGESGWNVHADNPSSSAYGIPQALPGSKMATAGADWEDNAATQIRWGLGYIKNSYGSPCGAWSFKQGHGWY